MVGLTFDLLTWISIGIIYSSRNIFLPSSDWEGKGPCAIVPFTSKMANRSLWRMIANGPLKISKSLKKLKTAHLAKTSSQSLTKYEASGAKRSWVISCIRYGQSTWPLTLTFDLLTWKPIGNIYSSRTIYLPSLKLLGQSIVELSVAQGMGDEHDLWLWPLTYWPEYQ